MGVRDIKRLLVPRSLALIGGAWADAVAAGNRAIGYTGQVWRVHPTRPSTATTSYYRSVEELPASPDAAFVAVPIREVATVVAALRERNSGGFVCFAAGFSETGTAEGEQRTRELITSAASLPFFGPNCYGFVNFFDRVALWPDQVVGRPLERGVALICQSGTIALTLMFNERSVPIGFIFTVGNQTSLAVEDLIELLSHDERVSAFGLYIEGIKDVPRLARAAAIARAAGKPIAVVKAGRTQAAARTVQSHTGSLAGADVVFDAFCRQAGVARCDTLATLCETLKVFHTGALAGRRVLVMGASGGDMAMTADLSRHLGLEFAPLPQDTAARLREILTDRVTLANPLDFHTYIWFDRAALRAMFTAVMRSGFDAVGFVLDCPPEGKADVSAFSAVIDEFIGAAAGAPSRAILISSLPETLSTTVRERCFAAGVVPLQGQREALEALSLAGAVGTRRGASEDELELRIPQGKRGPERTLPEGEAKAALAAFGLRVPHSKSVTRNEVAGAATALGFPVVVKVASVDLAHKSDVGGVILNVRTASEAAAAAERLSALTESFLVEEMITDGVAEILVGAVVDAQFGLTLVIGAGGVLTELLQDSVSLLPPFTQTSIEAGLEQLTVNKMLRGFRGRPLADVPALVTAIIAVGRYAEANLDSLVELDVNPVIVRPAGAGAVAVDALIRLA